MIHTLLCVALLGACATKDETSEGDAQDASTSSGEPVTTAAATTTPSSTDGGSAGPAIPGGCIACSFLLGFVGMDVGADAGMMPGDGGGMPMPELCEGTSVLLDAFVECGCAGSCAETCAAACGAEFGMEAFTCLTCAVDDPACAGVVAACESDDPGQLEGTSTGATSTDTGGSGGATGTTG
ncbi:MAG: hypothetical protein IAG13_26335 [Deltaproteobacteria bacterium]|nr:hypothetical protein [Nannocystaceae bacterium]